MSPSWCRRCRPHFVELETVLLKQLTIDRGDVSKSLSEFRAAHIKERSLPTPSELVEGLKVELNGFERTYIILDGLDECSGELIKPLVESLCALIPTKLLVTSRDTPAIREILGDRGFGQLEIVANKADLESYIDAQLTGSDLGSMIDRSKSINREEVKQSIIRKANGM